MDVLIETFDREPRALCRIPTISESLSFRNVHFFELFYICKEHLRRQAVCLYIIDQTIRIICKGIRRLLLVHIRGEKKSIFTHLSFVERLKGVQPFRNIIPRVYINTHAPNHLHTFKYFYNNLLFYLYHKLSKTKKKIMRHCRQISQIN